MKKALIGFAALLAVLIVVIASRPSEFVVERSATLAAPAEVVASEITNFRNWTAWSPWENRDANMKKTYEGPEQGVGAIYTWQGNDEVGHGKMTIQESTSTRIAIDLEFIAPWEAKNLTEFLLAPEGDGTKVTWKMSGKNGFAAKAFSMFMDMDAMVGADFEKGLAALKTVSEAKAKKAAEEKAAAEAKALAEAQAAADAAAVAPNKK